MVIATDTTRICACCDGRMPTMAPAPRSTKLNSPPCDRSQSEGNRLRLGQAKEMAQRDDYTGLARQDTDNEQRDDTGLSGG